MHYSVALCRNQCHVYRFTRTGWKSICAIYTCSIYVSSNILLIFMLPETTVFYVNAYWRSSNLKNANDFFSTNFITNHLTVVHICSSISYIPIIGYSLSKEKKKNFIGLSLCNLYIYSFFSITSCPVDTTGSEREISSKWGKLEYFSSPSDNCHQDKWRDTVTKKAKKTWQTIKPISHSIQTKKKCY